MKKESVEKLQDQVDTFNGFYEEGTPVLYTDDFGNKIETKTRSKAWVLGGHTPVIQIEGRAGCFLLNRIQAIETHRL